MKGGSQKFPERKKKIFLHPMSHKNLKVLKRGERGGKGRSRGNFRVQRGEKRGGKKAFDRTLRKLGKPCGQRGKSRRPSYRGRERRKP